MNQMNMEKCTEVSFYQVRYILLGMLDSFVDDERRRKCSRDEENMNEERSFCLMEQIDGGDD